MTITGNIPDSIPTHLHGVYLEGVKSGKVRDNDNAYLHQLEALKEQLAIATDEDHREHIRARIAKAQERRDTFLKGRAYGGQFRTRLKGGLER
jgi:hypothetical protein